MRFSCTSLALLAALAIPAAAHADTDYFTITSGSDTLTFSLPASPTLSPFTDGDVFTVNNVAVVFDGISGSDDISFYTSTYGGGFIDNFFDPYSVQLFTGDVSAPTFLNGSFDFSNEAFGGPVDGNVTISSTPEPSALLLFGTGALGLAGFARPRRRA